MQDKLKTGKWDTFYSTYYWVIHLDKNHPANTTEKLVGYSKRVGEHEAQDKDQLLKRKILNLFLNSYFKRMTRIEFFMRTEFAIDKKRDPNILNLFPTHYDIPELNHDIVFKRWGVFLKDFYDRVNKNKSMDGILPKARGLKNPDDFLNTDNYEFKNVGQLYAHAARCITHGHPPGAVNDFILKYKILRGW